jgi:hypothetical protein
MQKKHFAGDDLGDEVALPGFGAEAQDRQGPALAVWRFQRPTTGAPAARSSSMTT